MVKLEMISGPFQAILFTVITWKPESNCTCREKNFRIPLKFVDVTRATNTSLDVMLENKSTRPGGRGPQGLSRTGGGGLAMFPNLHVCKHLFTCGVAHAGEEG